MPLLELCSLCKSYRAGEERVYALQDVSLGIESGEFVAITGQSGSGKSTLMNLLGCLDLPDSGTYRLDGQDVAKLGERDLSRIRNQQIGFIFQGFNLIPTLTALENVELPLLYRGISHEQRRQLALTALEQVGLSRRLSHYPAQLSGGQQQRAAIARAIAAAPPILLADEPTGNLDPQSGAEVMEILHRLNRMGRTVVLITHDQQIAACARRQIHIAAGRLVSDLRLSTSYSAQAALPGSLHG